MAAPLEGIRVVESATSSLRLLHDAARRPWRRRREDRAPGLGAPRAVDRPFIGVSLAFSNQPQQALAALDLKRPMGASCS